MIAFAPLFRRGATALAIALAMLPGVALAHHPMGGKTPDSLVQGLLSGLGHPVIGLDHLAFIIAIGVACALAGVRSALFPAVLVGATGAGVFAHWAGLALPMAELVVAISVVAVGLLLLTGSAALVRFAPLAVIAAVFHGNAYGEAIIGAEATPLGAYLYGLVLVQTLVALAAFAGTTWLRGRLRAPARKRALFLGSGVVSLVGAAHVLSAVAS